MGRNDAQTVNVYVREPIHVHLHLDGVEIPLRVDLGDLPPNTQIAEILSSINVLTKGVDRMAGELESLTAEVERNTSVDASAIALLNGLKAQLDAAGTDPTKLQRLKDQLSESSQQLADAVSRNTPAAGLDQGQGSAQGGGGTPINPDDPNAPRPDNTLPGDLPPNPDDQPQVNPLSGQSRSSKK